MTRHDPVSRTLTLRTIDAVHRLRVRGSIRLPDGLPQRVRHVGAPRAVAALRFKGDLVAVFDLDEVGPEPPPKAVHLHVAEIGDRLVGLVSHRAGMDLHLPDDLLVSPEFSAISGFVGIEEEDDVLALPDLGDFDALEPQPRQSA